MHRVASLAKRWILGTRQGAIDHAHLHDDLNEFVFRFNLETAVDRRKTHQVAVANEQFERRSITGLELLRSRWNCRESRANTRSALLCSNDNCGFWVQSASLPQPRHGVLPSA
ncbi:MAG: hypothetical protein ING59_04050 [Burkholderiales bacterium]|nr:hypothetical protein [Burkholderiales bacterium]